LRKLGDVKNKPVEDMTALERWAYFFAYYTDPGKEKVLRQITEHEEEILMAQKMLYKITPAEEQALYQMSVDKANMDRASREDDFRQRLKSGKARAHRKGLKEGRAEGVSTVIELLRKGFTLEQVESYLRENGLQS
jgi:flagellar biosynthesis/type III secretory pathway protein FliH